MKRIISIAVALIMLLSAINVSALQLYYDDGYHTYDGNIFTLKVDGKVLNCEVPPVVFDGYSVVPARDVFESLGATVTWRDTDQKVTVIYGGVKVELFINSTIAIKNGMNEIMPIAPKLINGKTMIPARYVAESLGFGVEFDGGSDTISITSQKSPSYYQPVGSVSESTLTGYSYAKEGNTFVATFTLSQSIGYSHFTLDNPARIVVDTQKTVRNSNLVDAATGLNDVTGIRFGQQPGGVRIVFDLMQMSAYSVGIHGNKLVVRIGEDVNQRPPEDESVVEEPVIPDPPSYPPSRTVYLDPGHGGDDPGAIHTDESGVTWRECDINLSVALKVRDILEANNVKVLMSRTTNKTVGLVDRPKDANAKQATLFVSVHTNSFVADSAHGIETWGTLYLSATYAGITDKTLAQNIQNAVIKETGGYSRGIKDSTGLAVLRHSIMPSVLIEVGFISNNDERWLMFTDDYRNRLARGIADGILKTLTQMGL